MTNDPADNATLTGLLDRLRQVLEVERSTLLGGRPDEIATVTGLKIELADRIEQEFGSAGAPLESAAALTALARYNRENAVICSAMLRHLTDALDHLRQHELHHSYNSDGSESRASLRQPLGAA